MQRLLPPALVLLSIVFATALSSVLPGAGPGSLAWRLPGAFLLVIGAALSARGSALFAQVGTNVHTFGEPGKLVATGLFGFSRNPMYLGFLILLTGVAVLLGTLTAWVAPLAFFAAASFWYIPFEEQRMRDTFGTDYERYQQTVNRWIGRV